MCEYCPVVKGVECGVCGAVYEYTNPYVYIPLQNGEAELVDVLSNTVHRIKTEDRYEDTVMVKIVSSPSENCKSGGGHHVLRKD